MRSPGLGHRSAHSDRSDAIGLLSPGCARTESQPRSPAAGQPTGERNDDRGRSPRTGWMWFRFICSFGAITCSLCFPLDYYLVCISIYPSPTIWQIIYFLGIIQISIPLSLAIFAGCWLDFVRNRQKTLTIAAWLSLFCAALVLVDWIVSVKPYKTFLFLLFVPLPLPYHFLCLWVLLLTVSLTAPGVGGLVRKLRLYPSSGARRPR